MQYRVDLPLPGGVRQAIISLSGTSGTMTDPYESEKLCILYDVHVTAGHMAFKTKVGRTEFILDGEAAENGYILNFTTLETIPLEPGTRLKGIPGALEGEYLVGVYSPGGIKENHFVIEKTPKGYIGEMYGLVDQKTIDFMQQMMLNSGPGGPEGPGGPPAGAPPMEPMPAPKLGDKTDINFFSSVSGDADGFTVITHTGMGSEFRFDGTIEGDSILMTLHVTDVHDGVQAILI